MVFAQDAPSSGGWRRFDQSQDPTQPVERIEPQAQRPADPPPYGLPPQLTIKPGTFVTVRVDEMLSSDRNQESDVFSATLMQPIVVDGVVVAQRGQTILGRVAEARKAGRVEGVSRLGLELTALTLVDGTQAAIQSQLLTRDGRSSVGRDVSAVANTTAMGAAVGAAADWDRGAAIGAGAGAAVGVIGVLLTRGHPTVIHPESVLTFRIESPVTVSTTRAPQAFRYVDPNDYDRPVETRVRPRPPACGGYGCASPPYWGPVYSPYPYYGPYYGAGVGIVIGRGGWRRWR